MIDRNIVQKITNLTLIENEKILEIGPGIGFLTDEIIKKKPKKLIIIEKDNKLSTILKKKYSNNNITLFNKDIFNYDLQLLSEYKIISNLPYNISSKFLLKILSSNTKIKEIICMIQSELANKFDYNKGKMNKYKFLSKLKSNYKIKFKVSPNVFFPKPKVNSNVVIFKLKKTNIDHNRINYFINKFFINKRKKIKSNKYFKNKIDHKYINERYEDLDYESILEIYKRF